MEEGAPLDPSSGGTPTAMVAVPMLNTALGQRFSILGGTGTGTKMEASIHLRAKDFAAHERWLANLAGPVKTKRKDAYCCIARANSSCCSSDVLSVNCRATASRVGSC